MVALTSWPKIILTIFLFILAILMAYKYYKKRTKERQIITIYFIINALGWAAIMLATELLLNNNMLGYQLIIFGPSLVGIGALILFVFSFIFVKYKKMWIPYTIGGLITITYMTSLILFPINFIDNTFDFHSIQDLFSILVVIIALFTGIFFIKTSFRKEFKQEIKKKTMMYGVGLIMRTIGSFAAAILYGALLVNIAVTLIIIGSIIIFMAEK